MDENARNSASSPVCGDDECGGGGKVKGRKFIQKFFGLKSKVKVAGHRSSSRGSSVFHDEVQPAYRTNLIIVDGSKENTFAKSNGIVSSGGGGSMPSRILKSKSYPAPAPPASEPPFQDENFRQASTYDDDEKLSKRERQTKRRNCLESEYGNSVTLTSATVSGDYRRSAVAYVTSADDGETADFVTVASTDSDKNTVNTVDTAADDVIYDSVHRDESGDSIVSVGGCGGRRANTNCSYDYAEVSAHRIETSANDCESAALKGRRSLANGTSAKPQIKEMEVEAVQEKMQMSQISNSQKDFDKCKAAKQHNSLYQLPGKPQQQQHQQQQQTQPQKLQLRQQQQQLSVSCNSDVELAAEEAEYSKLNIIRQYNRRVDYSNSGNDIKVCEASIILSPELSDDSDDADATAAHNHHTNKTNNNKNDNKNNNNNDKNNNKMFPHNRKHDNYSPAANSTVANSTVANSSTSAFDFGEEISTKNLIVTSDSDGIVKRLSNFKLRPSASTKRIPPIPVSSFDKSLPILPDEMDFEDEEHQQQHQHQHQHQQQHQQQQQQQISKSDYDIDNRSESDLADTRRETNEKRTFAGSSDHRHVSGIIIASSAQSVNNINGGFGMGVAVVDVAQRTRRASTIAHDRDDDGDDGDDDDVAADKLRMAQSPLSTCSSTATNSSTASSCAFTALAAVGATENGITATTAVRAETMAAVAAVTADGRINAEYLRLMEMFTKWEMMTSENSAAKSDFQKSLIDQQKIVYDLWAKQLAASSPATVNSASSDRSAKMSAVSMSSAASAAAILRPPTQYSETRVLDSSPHSFFSDSSSTSMKKSELLLESPYLIRGVLSNFAKIEAQHSNLRTATAETATDAAHLDSAVALSCSSSAVTATPTAAVDTFSNKIDDIGTNLNEKGAIPPHSPVFETAPASASASKRLAATKWRRTSQTSAAASRTNAAGDASSSDTELAESFRKFEERKRRKKLQERDSVDSANFAQMTDEMNEPKDTTPKPSTSMAAILNGSKWHSESKASLVSRTNYASSTASAALNSDKTFKTTKKLAVIEKIAPKSTYVRPNADELRFATLRKVGAPRERCGIEMGSVVSGGDDNRQSLAVSRKSDEIRQKSPTANAKSSWADDEKKFDTNGSKHSTIAVGTRDTLMEAIRMAGGFQSLKKTKKENI